MAVAGGLRVLYASVMEHRDGTIESRVCEPFTVAGGAARRGVVVLCDHASNALPTGYGTLGLPPHEFARHIAYDIGAAGVARGLAARLGAPAVLSNFSRLLIDLNRGCDDPTLIMRISDGAVIEGNRVLDNAERACRIARYYAPYHDAVRGTIEACLSCGVAPMIVSIHSYTPVWRGVARHWHAALLWDRDPRLAVAMIDALRADPALVIGDNEPYHGALRGDTLWQHGTRRGLAHALVEIRQDLIADEAGQAQWAARLARIIARFLETPVLANQLLRVEHYGSQTDI